MGMALIDKPGQGGMAAGQTLLLGDLPAGKIARTPATLLMVNASEMSARTVKAALAGLGYVFIEARVPSEAMTAVAQHSIDLVLIDVTTPLSGGMEFCRLLKKSTATQFLPVYMIGNCDDLEEEVRALEAGADEFLMRPLRPRAFKARIQASLRHKAMIDSLDDSEAVLFSLAQSVEDRDPELGQHCHRLALMGATMGLTLGLAAAEILALQRGGYLHDIGKVAVPDTVLFKPGPLTPEEWETMKAHAERGAKICGGMRSLAPVLPIIRHHHEKWDGSGYPGGLRGEDIPLLARILQLADIYDALTTARPYKEALTPQQALLTIRKEAQRGWRDPKLVEIFVDILPTFRTAPAATDHSHFSLHALAASVERFRREPSRLQGRLEQSGVSQEFKLVSGF